MSDVFSETQLQELKELYLDDIQNIDFLVGIALEPVIDGGSTVLGELASKIVEEQFVRLAQSDLLFETYGGGTKTGSVSLADLIAMHT
eukprot:UN02280